MQVSWDGFTPLHLAAAFGHAPVVSLLLSHAADSARLDRYPAVLAPLCKGVGLFVCVRVSVFVFCDGVCSVVWVSWRVRVRVQACAGATNVATHPRARGRRRAA